MYRELLKRTLTVCAVLTLTACAHDLTQKPAWIEPGIVATESPESQIAATAVLPIDVLRGALEDAVPRAYSRSENGPDLCHDFGFPLGKHCAGTRYDLSVSRSGFSVGGTDGAIIASVEMSASGNGGFRGDGCRILSCNAKSFAAKVRLDVKVRPSIDANWCPTVDVALDYAWIQEPRVEIVGGVWIDVGGFVREPLNNARASITAAAQSAIPCASFRDQIAGQYRTLAVPVELPNADRAFVNFEPTGASFSGVLVSPSEIRVAAGVRGKLAVDSAPIEVRALPLPRLQAAAPGDARLRLAVPVHAAYEQLRNQLSHALAGQSFKQTMPVGTTVVTVHDVDLYPNDQRLVLGVKFSADLPGRWFDAKGWAYVAAIPSLQDQQLTLSNVAFAPVLDHDLWNELGAMFQGDIQDAITRAVQVDLSPQLTAAKQALTDALAGLDPAQPVHFALTDVNLRVDDLRLEPGAVALRGLFAADAVMTVTGAALTQP